jgi:hypothetical protein
MSCGPFQAFLAHTDAPEMWAGDMLLASGKHYGHLEIDVTLAASVPHDSPSLPVA